MSLALQHGGLYHVNGLFITHVSEDIDVGAEFFCLRKQRVGKVRTRTYDLKSGIKRSATMYHQKYM